MTNFFFYVIIKKYIGVIIISHLKSKIICFYKNIDTNCYFENKFIKVKKNNYFNKKLKNFTIPFEDSSFYYFIPNENNVKNIESLVLEENLKIPASDICKLFNYNKDFFYKYHLTNRNIIFDDNIFSQNEVINNIRLKQKNLIILPKITLRTYVETFERKFNIKPNVLFEKEFKQNNSNISFISYYKLNKLIENFHQFHFDNLNILELQHVFSDTTFHNLFLKNAPIPAVFKNILIVSNKIKNFHAGLFSCKCREEFYVLKELFDCDVILNKNLEFFCFDKPEQQFIINEEILKIKHNLFDF